LLNRAVKQPTVAAAARRLLAEARRLTPGLGDEPFALAEAALRSAPA